MKKCYKNQRLHTPRVWKTWFLGYVPVRGEGGGEWSKPCMKKRVKFITLKGKEGDTSNINTNIKLFSKVVNVTSPGFGMKSHNFRARLRYVRQPLLCMFVRKCSGRLLLARLLREPIVSRHSTNVRLTKQTMSCHSIGRSDLVDAETRRTTGRLPLPNFETVYGNFVEVILNCWIQNTVPCTPVLIGPFITADGADDLQV